jgi:hypothetical protein
MLQKFATDALLAKLDLQVFEHAFSFCCSSTEYDEQTPDPTSIHM